jgi:pimeloyl-ACP methyl ester carboxylesterase
MMNGAASPGREMLDRGDRPRLAYRHRPGRGPAIVFLPGYGSDMTGGKATALDAHAAATGRAMLRFDYAGCGESEGDFAAQTLEDWLRDTLAVIDALAEGPLIVVGSSMGGWLMLLAALARPQRIAGLVGIAAAPDFTDWGFDEAKRAELARAGVLCEPSDYDSPTVTTLGFWQSGQRQLLLGGEIAIDAPVRLLHGQMDDVVSWRIALDLAERLRSAEVQLTLVKDGDHRLSRDGDIALLIATVEALCSRF